MMLEAFPKEKIEPLIVNGFDDWGLLLEIKMDDLMEFKYSEEQALEILNCIKSIEENEPQGIQCKSGQERNQEEVKGKGEEVE